MSEEERRLLEQKLWEIANLLRGKMDADGYRDYILGFIFYKYLSEKIALFADTLLEADGLKFAELDENSPSGKKMVQVIQKQTTDELGYFLKPSELFHNIAKKGNRFARNDEDEEKQGSKDHFILGDLTRILKNIENSTLGTDSQDDFINLFEDLDLTSSKLGKTEDDKNKIVARILNALDHINFRLEDPKSDILGDAYEYLIAEFASGAGKKAGEFYTPQPVSTLLARIVTAEKKNLKSVYDPTCGSGSLLLRVKREIKKVGKIYGQELNRTTYNLARMNMILHGVHYGDFDIQLGDTLEHPQHDKGERFEAIVANPPFSAHWSAKSIFASDDRFSQYGKLAPATKADMAFVLHMTHHLADDGTMACVLPHGVLFRGAAEGHIRKHLIEGNNYLDTVIGLPANLFFGTSIPTCVLVFKKCRKHQNDILFIDASNDFEKVKTQNKLLPEHIDKIVQTYIKRESIEKYSRAVPLKEIKENDYNLNIPRYVDNFEQEEDIDLDALATELQMIDKEMQETDSKIAAFCKELGIKAPF